MVISEISLTPDNQQFGIVLEGVAYQIRVIWRETCWILDLMDASEKPIVMGIPLVTGADLLAQYSYLNLGFKLAVICDDSTQDYPTQTDLGTGSHLLVVTE